MSRHEKTAASTVQRRWRRLRGRGATRRAGLIAVALALTLGLAACGGGAPSGVTGPASPSAATGGSTHAPAPPAGRLTLLDGTSATLAAFRGGRTLVWFVADGCASCAASIPAVAQQFQAFRRSRTQILVLGIFGAFGDGAGARTQLASFGRAAAGSAFSDRAWTWGLASAGLTAAYDPAGVPDEYFLLDPGGRIVYRDSVPVSTMGALLSHLRVTGSSNSGTSSSGSSPPTTGTLP